MEIKVIVSNEEQKALESIDIDIAAWVENVIRNRARQAINKVVEKYSNKQASKLTLAEKLKIVKDATIITNA